MFCFARFHIGKIYSVVFMFLLLIDEVKKESFILKTFFKGLGKISN